MAGENSGNGYVVITNQGETPGPAIAGLPATQAATSSPFRDVTISDALASLPSSLGVQVKGGTLSDPDAAADGSSTRYDAATQTTSYFVTGHTMADLQADVRQLTWTPGSSATGDFTLTVANVGGVASSATTTVTASGGDLSTPPPTDGDLSTPPAPGTPNNADVQSTRTFAIAPLGSSGPDSLTWSGDGSLWVEYGNEASSTGQGGSSTVIQYDTQGRQLSRYTVSGSVDGLKLDPNTGDVWALQNQDGNSTLTLIDPATHQVSAPLSFALASATRGYDDVAFDKGQVFLSYTNPAATGDGVVQQLDNGNSPFGTLQTTDIVRLGDTGTNLTTGQTNQPLPVNDPDSLKTLADGTLVLTSDHDASYTFIRDPGTAAQSASFVTLPAGSSGLDDAITTNGATSGTFFVADTATGRVTQAQVTNLNPNDLYASVASDNGVVQIDPATGAVTPVLTGLTAPHGLVFLPFGSGTASTDTPASAASPLVSDAGSISGLVQALASLIASDLNGASLVGTAAGPGSAGTFNPAPVVQQFASLLAANPAVEPKLAALLQPQQT